GLAEVDARRGPAVRREQRRGRAAQAQVLMMRSSLLFSSLAPLALCAPLAFAQESAPASSPSNTTKAAREQAWKAVGREEPLVPVPFTAVEIDDAFWRPRLETNRKVTLEACLKQCQGTGRIRNFSVAGKRAEGQHEGALFNDSDVYKVLEGAAYCLAL